MVRALSSPPASLPLPGEKTWSWPGSGAGDSLLPSTAAALLGKQVADPFPTLLCSVWSSVCGRQGLFHGMESVRGHGQDHAAQKPWQG